MFSIVIPTLGLARQSNIRYFYKKRYDLTDCLLSLSENYDVDHVQIIVIFNNCKDSEIKKIREEFPFIKFAINRQNVGVARSWNIGANLSEFENICFLNDDCVVNSDILVKYSNILNEDNEVGVIGPQGSYWNNLEHHSFYEGVEPGFSDVISGFCFMTSHSTLRKTGYFDISYTPAGYEEIDFCFNVKLLGMKNCVWPSNDIIHNIVHGVSGTKQIITYFDESISTEDLHVKNKAIFLEKWKNEGLTSLLKA